MFGLLTLLAFVGCQPESESPMGEPSKPEHGSTPEALLEGFESARLRTEEEVRKAIDIASRASVSVSYLHLAWSVESELHRRTFAQFAAQHGEALPNSLVTFHFIDCTPLTRNYDALTSLPGWKKDDYEVAGWGEVMWMVEGRVIDVAPLRDFSGSEALMKKTALVVKTQQDSRATPN